MNNITNQQIVTGQSSIKLETSNYTFHSSIPVLDMRDCFHPTRRPLFVKGLKEAFQTFGFIAVVNAKIDDSVLDRAYETVKQFFKQPLEIKQEIKSATNSGERGYVHTESPKGQGAHVSDYKEFIHIGRELVPEQKLRLGYPENIWPRHFNLKDPMQALYQSLELLVEPLSEAISEAMGMHPSFLREMTGEGDHLLRTVHYPANPPAGESWAAEHTDINLFTLLPRATAEGLQLKMQNGTWLDVAVPENALVINIGDMLQNLTNGLFRSSVHRVEAKKQGMERFSIVLFAHARREDKMNPMANCVEQTGGQRKYPNATRQQLLEQRIVEMGRASFKMMTDLRDSGLIEEEVKLGLDCSKAIGVLAKNNITNEFILKQLSK